MSSQIEFIHERTSKRAHVLNEDLITHSKQADVLMAKFLKIINKLQIELGHPLEVIMHATGKAMFLKLTITFITFEDCVFKKAKRGWH